MNMPKISIIIPVYNTDKYLKECLDSCINQTLSDIEIICVDDCSTDNSLKILEEYKTKNSRIKVFHHEINKKQGAARNTGMDNATGEYIWFVDSDDFIDKNACQLLYDTIKENNVDLLSFCGISFVDSDKKRKYLNSSFFQGLHFNKIYLPDKRWREMNFYNISASPCLFIVKKEVVERFRFRENVFHEDTDFTPILISFVSSMCCIAYTAYYRRLETGSETQGIITKKRLDDSIAVINSLNNFVVDNNISSRHFLYKFMVEYINNISVLCKTYENLHPVNIKEIELFNKKYSPMKITILYRKLKGYLKDLFYKIL